MLVEDLGEPRPLRVPFAQVLFWARAVAAGWLIGGPRVAGIVLGASLVWELVVVLRKLWVQFRNQA